MRLQHLCFKLSTTVFAIDVKTDQDKLGDFSLHKVHVQSD